MSVPTHNLYKFIHGTLKNKFYVHFFYPWGCKDINNIIGTESRNCLEDLFGAENIVAYKIFPKDLVGDAEIVQTQPLILCHDQEPLMYSLYENYNIEDYIKNEYSVYPTLSQYNLRWRRLGHYQKYWILLHSELNSTELQKYESTERFVGAYYWSHALIARDWYRYAEWDPSLLYNAESPNEKHFLIYSRDDSGSRSYRKDFKTKLQNIKSMCQFSSFHEDTLSSDSSASYNSYDFTHTDFSVVLETVFDNRIHLTEKTLRPLACGHPFWLVAGPRSLEYLRSYGFKTFSPWIDESYDAIVESESRMDCIIQSMQTYALTTNRDKYRIRKKCLAIAEYNKKLFFKNKFIQQVVNELHCNVEKAYQKTNCEVAIEDVVTITKTKIKNEPHLSEKNHKRSKIYHYLKKFQDHLKTGGTLEDYVPPDSK